MGRAFQNNWNKNEIKDGSIWEYVDSDFIDC